MSDLCLCGLPFNGQPHRLFQSNLLSLDDCRRYARLITRSGPGDPAYDIFIRKAFDLPCTAIAEVCIAAITAGLSAATELAGASAAIGVAVTEPSTPDSFRSRSPCSPVPDQSTAHPPPSPV